MTDLRRPLLAVLIDAENTAAKIAPALFAEIAKLGDARLRRIYGNFSRPNVKPWDAQLAKFSIEKVHIADHVPAKNSADISLAIDAMDQFHIGRFDGFCIVSSDSDFTALAERLRKRGVRVFGFGKKETRGVFQNACDKFIHIEQLMPKPKTPDAKPQNPKPAKPVSRANAQPPVPSAP